MLDSVESFISTDSGKVVIPALIGAVTAILIMVFKDFILYEIRESKKEKRALIDKKLSVLYGPLYTVVVSANQTLPTFFMDKTNYRDFVAHQHLLSSELQSMIDECLSLGDGSFENPTARINDMPKVFEISEKIKVQLKKEMDILRKNYS
ncbi:hypothetical protein BA893_06980 [Vibrio natriegens]|uniref:hypothetical protein n=1 Tax=Vibrio natriegens TaxID=691 RepID=UPI0008044078|nr:hypothetical protein [Vibrio natriegens]ANQ21424.1 hypothetical protein BA893_06980 [Vibrio natriegens]